MNECLEACKSYLVLQSREDRTRSIVIEVRNGIKVRPGRPLACLMPAAGGGPHHARNAAFQEEGSEMPVTAKIPRSRLAGYLDAFTKRFLRDGSPEAVDVEVLVPEWGEQFAAEGARLLGITYDTHTNALEF